MTASESDNCSRKEKKEMERRRREGWKGLLCFRRGRKAVTSMVPDAAAGLCPRGSVVIHMEGAMPAVSLGLYSVS